MNVMVNYLYRDQGNYKQRGCFVLSNPNHHNIEYLKEVLQNKLVDGSFFYAEKYGIPTLFFETTRPGDISWHELADIEISLNEPTLKMSIDEFISKLE